MRFCAENCDLHGKTAKNGKGKFFTVFRFAQFALLVLVQFADYYENPKYGIDFGSEMRYNNTTQLFYHIFGKKSTEI